jgi:hypothetical protein
LIVLVDLLVKQTQHKCAIICMDVYEH